MEPAREFELGRDDLEIAPRTIDGETVYFVGDPIKHAYHRLDLLQYEIFRRLDGKTSLEEISAWLLKEYELEAPPEALAEFVGNLRSLNLLDLPTDYDDDVVRGREAARKIKAQLDKDGVVYGIRGAADKGADNGADEARERETFDLPERRGTSTAAVSERELFNQALVHLRSGRVQASARRLRTILVRSPRNARARYLLHAIFAEYLGKPKDVDSIFFWRIPIANPDRFLARVDKAIGWALFRPATLVIWALTFLAAGLTLAGDFERYAVDLKHFLTFSWFDDAVFFPVLFWTVGPLLIFVHEVSHGLTCRHYGGRVREMGILIAYFSATAYCDISSTYLLESRWQRALTCFAGTMWHAFAWSIFVFLYHLTDPTSYIGLLSVVSIPVLITTVFSGCNPLVRSDGYFALTELVNYPNLNVDALEYVKGRAKELVLGVPQEIPDEYRPHARLFTVYIVGSAVMLSVVIYLALSNIVGYLIARLHTFGVVLALLLLWFTVGRRVVGAAKGLWAIRKLLWSQRRSRLVVVGSVVAVVGVLLTPWRVVIESPARLRPDVVVVRGPQDGRVAAVYVEDGAVVVKGQPLCALEGSALAAAVLKAEAEVVAADLDLQGLRRGSRDEELAVAAAAVRAAAADLAAASRRVALVSKRADAEALDRERADEAAARTRRVDAQRALDALQAGPHDDEVLAAEARLKSLTAQLEGARAQRDNATLKSPRDGIVDVVGDLTAASLLGRRIASGEPLFEVRKPGGDVLELRVPTAEPVGLLRAGTPVEGRLFGLPGAPITGTIVSIGSTVERDDSGEGDYVRVDVDLDDEWQKQLLPAGLQGKARTTEGRRSLIAYAWLRLVRLVEIDVAALL